MRFYLRADEATRARVVEVLRRAYPEVLGAVEAGRERVRERDEPGTEIVSAFFLFETPLWGERSPTA